MNTFKEYITFSKIFFSIYFRECEQEKGQRERENPGADTTLSVEPNIGLHLETRNHDLRQNKDSGVQLTEPPEAPNE